MSRAENRTETRGMLSLCSCSALHENSWRSGRSIVPIVLFDKAWTTTVSKSHQGHATDKDWHQAITIKPCWEVTDSEWAELPSLSVVGVNQNIMSLWRRPNCTEDLDLISDSAAEQQLHSAVGLESPPCLMTLSTTELLTLKPLHWNSRGDKGKGGRMKRLEEWKQHCYLFGLPVRSFPRLNDAFSCSKNLWMEDMTKDGGDKGGGSRRHCSLSHPLNVLVLLFLGSSQFKDKPVPFLHFAGRQCEQGWTSLSITRA